MVKILMDIKMVHSSMPKVAMLPIQDVPGPEWNISMNRLGSQADNWLWQLGDWIRIGANGLGDDRGIEGPARWGQLGMRNLIFL